MTVYRDGDVFYSGEAEMSVVYSCRHIIMSDVFMCLSEILKGHTIDAVEKLLLFAGRDPSMATFAFIYQEWSARLV